MYALSPDVVFLEMAAMALDACNAADHRASNVADPAPVATQLPRMQTGGTLPPRLVYDAQPDFRGLGPLRFGMDAAHRTTMGKDTQ